MDEAALLSQTENVKGILSSVISTADSRNYHIDTNRVEQAKFACISMAAAVYGKDSIQITQLLDAKKPDNAGFHQNLHLARTLLAFVTNLEYEIRNNLVASIRQAAQSEILADFLYLAKQVDPNVNKDVAAVLAAAALEDTLKKIAKQIGIDADDKEMTDVVNALKSRGKFSGPQGPIVTGYVKLRNKAFHAEWDKFEAAEVVSLIGFTETLILQELGS